MTVREILLEFAFDASVEEERDGTLGKILILRNPPNTHPERVAVKTVLPGRVKRGTTYEALQRFAHEVQHWIRYRHHPLIVTPFFTRFVEKWPYVAMPYCESNLRQHIAGSISRRGTSEAVALVAQVLEALSYAQGKGLLAHQDLKPENVLLQDLRRRYPDLGEDYPFIWTPRLADFGLANGYKELGVPWGSRPYLAPEQYEQGRDLSSVDVFACGVMLHELLTGLHPVGVVTHRVWPDPLPGEPTKWCHESKWKQWARSTGKVSEAVAPRLGPYAGVVEAALGADPGARPSTSQFRDTLLTQLMADNPAAHENLTLLLAHYRSICEESESSGDTDERYQELHMRALLRTLTH